MFTRTIARCLDYIKSDGGYLSHVGGDFPVNTAVLAALPAGTSIVSAFHYGESSVWFATGRIVASTSVQDERVNYFIKYGAGSLAKSLLASEFHCARKLDCLVPGSTPKPITWGPLFPFGSKPDGVEGYFLVTEFVDFSDEDGAALPKEEVADLVSRLHHALPGPRFGSPLPTYDGILVHVDGWEATWPALFSKMLARAYNYDRLTNGACDVIEAAHATVQKVVVPRLLSGLTEDGGRRPIDPCFIHGDLWEGNIRRQRATGRCFVFDSNGYYAHREMELAYWTTRHHRMHLGAYSDAYLELFGPSGPVDEVHDRLKLYSIKAYLMYSAQARDHPVRQDALRNLEYLASKYADTAKEEAQEYVTAYTRLDMAYSAQEMHMIEINTEEEIESLAENM